MSFDPRPRPDPRRPDPVALVWVVGVALALIAYAVGPDRLVASVIDGFQRASWYFDQLFHNLTAAMREGLRAAAIGFYGAFVGLTLIALRRRAPGLGSLVVVSVIFLLLVWGAANDSMAANARWLAALLLAAGAAFGATRRLGRPGPPRG
jgi:hypothetical protein